MDEFPSVRFQRAGDQFITVILRYSNGTTSSETYRKRENVEDIAEAAKEYESTRKEYENTDSLNQTLGFREEVEEAYDNLLQLVEPYKRFEVQGILEKDNQGNYFLGGYNTPIPETMADLIVEHQEAGLDIDHLVEFWKKCLLNPNDQAREDLFKYINNHGIVITDNGYMVLYKAVTTKNKRVPDDDLAQFVGAEYLKRKNWGKNPADYYVYEAEEEIILPNNHTVEGLFVSKMPALRIRDDVSVSEPNGNGWTVKQVVNRLGTLEELHDDVNQLSRESETVYTDKHTQTFEYNLGEAHSMPREECDSNPSRGCSRGLHCGSYDYVKNFGHSPSRDVIQAVLVNPMHVVAIPHHDSSKIRTCEFYAYGIMERDEDGVWHELETEYFEEDYEAHEEEDLEERLSEISGSLVVQDSDLEEDQVNAAQDRLVDLRNN